MWLVIVLVGLSALVAWVLLGWWRKRATPRDVNPILQPALEPAPNPALERALVATDTTAPNAGDVLLDSAVSVHEDTPAEDVAQQRAIHESLWIAATTYRYGLGGHDVGQSGAAARAIYQYLSHNDRVDPVMRADAGAELHVLDQEERNRSAYHAFLNRPSHAHVLDMVERMHRVDHPVAPPGPSPVPVAIQHEPGPVRSDTQNVHDSGMVASMRATLAKLKEHQAGKRNVGEDLDDMRRALDKSSKAQRALDAMARNSIPLSAYGQTESEILSLVWGRIQDPVNADQRAELVSSLQNSLEGCYEGPNNDLVCATGRTTRAVQSLEKTDRADLVSLRPKWALDQEIQTTSGRVYQQVLESSSPDEQSACTKLEEDATPHERERQASVKSRFSDVLRRNLHDSYRGVLSDDQIEARVQSMAALI